MPKSGKKKAPETLEEIAAKGERNYLPRWAGKRYNINEEESGYSDGAHSTKEVRQREANALKERTGRAEPRRRESSRESKERSERNALNVAGKIQENLYDATG